MRKQIRIYRIIIPPGHGESKIDSKCGKAKTRFDFVYSQDPLLAKEDPNINKLKVSLHKMEDGEQTSVYDILSQWKFSTPEEKRELKERRCHL